MRKIPVAVSWFFCSALGLTLVWGAFTSRALAQTSSPTAEERKPRQYGNFAIRSDFEIGSAVLDLHGSKEKYRTDVNLLSGGRLQSFYIDLRPDEGKSSWFDVAVIRGRGFGGVDPFENLNFNLRGNRKFDFRFNYSKDNYFFNVPGFALGLHSDDNLRRNLNFGLDYYIRPTFKLRLAHSEIKRSGNSFSSADIFNDVFRLLLFNRRRTDDYRVGFDWEHSALGVSFDQNFRSFRFDNRFGNVTSDQPGLTPAGVRLDGYSEDIPTRGRLPASALTLKYRKERFDAVGRYEYSRGNIDFSRSDPMLIR